MKQETATAIETLRELLLKADPSKMPPAIRRLVEEVRDEREGAGEPSAYDRAHFRHNRGPGGGYMRAHNRHNR